MMHGLIQSPHLTNYFKTASNKTSPKQQSVLSSDTLAIPPKTTKTITAYVGCTSEWKTTGTVTQTEKFTKTANLLISYSMSTIFDKKTAVRVTKTTDSPF